MNKTVFITGSSSGIGRITAEYFQAMGWNVAATMRHPERENELNQLPNLRCIQLDVVDNESITAAVSETIKHFGGIDVLVNNAGYGAVGPFEAATEEQIRRQFDTNVFGLMNVTKAVLPHFREKRNGIIINVASLGGRITWPLYSVYHASKWAVEGFSESLSYELRPFGVTVKIIEPGAIFSDFFARSQDLFHKPELTSYDEYVDLVMPNLQQMGADAPGPELVADKIYKAATDQSAKLRYPVGKGSGLILWLRGKISTHTFSRLVRSRLEKRIDRLARYRKEAR